MRTPTPQDEAFAWWRSALAGGRPPIHTEPHCGFYKRKLVKGGAWVPARIYLEQSLDDAGELLAPEVLRCDVNGVQRDPIDQWCYLADEPISEAEYRYLVSLSSWARTHAPEHPAGDGRAVDFLNAPIPF